jgi:hypothetical protein
LNAFDAFFYTRNGQSFGTGLSSSAAANVSAYVGSTGNVVLLNGDFADGVASDPYIKTLFTNAANFAGSSGHGFIGEFNGAVAGLTSNSSGFNPLNLISGSAGPIIPGGGGSTLPITLTAAGMSHAVTSGLATTYEPDSVGFGAVISGVSAPLILATYQGGGAAIIATPQTSVATAPEPSMIISAGTGVLMFACYAWRRRRRAVA